MGRCRAPGPRAVTDCNIGSVGAGTCERLTEGSADPAVFGGADSAYNAGTMKYVQIRYSGYILGAGVELQALTAEGIGSGTTLEFIQSHNSSDDGAEFFGGTVNFKHYIATGADDDSLDFDTGGQGAFQYVLIIQRPARATRCSKSTATATSRHAAHEAGGRQLHGASAGDEQQQ